MTTDTAHRIAHVAAELRRSHHQAPALDVLDLLLMSDEASLGVEFPAARLHPRTPLGQLIAAAFDRGMTEREWHDFTAPPADPALIAAVLGVWMV